MNHPKNNMFFFLSLIILSFPLISSVFDEYNNDLGKKTPLNSLIDEVKNNFFSANPNIDLGDQNKPGSTTAYAAVLAEQEEGHHSNNLQGQEEELPVEQTTIFEHLFNLGARYNKHITFIMLSFGVVLALIFPQKTKSILDETKSKIVSFFEKIKITLGLTSIKSKKQQEALMCN